MKKIFVCSPYAGDIKGNTELAVYYCRLEVRDGNCPFAPHLLYPQILDEKTDRQRGINFGLEILKTCDELHVYGDRISYGMEQEILLAFNCNIPVKFCGYIRITGIGWEKSI